MECLKNTVQILDPCNEREEGVVYLNDLPYFSFDAFAMLRDSQEETPQAVFTSLEREAGRRLYADVLAASRGFLKRRRKEKAIVSGKFQSNRPAIPAESYLKGFFVDLSDDPYQEATFSRLDLYAASGGAQTLYFYDLETGARVKEYPITLSAGYNSILFTPPVKISSKVGVFVAYDGNEIESRKISGELVYQNGFMCHCSTLSGGYYKAEITDLETDTFFADSLEPDSLPGFLLHYTVSCSPEAFFCDNREGLINPYLYALALTYFERVRRIGLTANAATLMPDEEAAQILDYLKGQYREGIEAFLQALRPSPSFCFQCNSYINVQRLTP
jgi:hypothetical protein